VTVIDPNILRTQPELVRESQIKRGEDATLVDQWLAADIAAREGQQAFDLLRNEQKILGKEMGPLQGALKKNPTTELTAQVDALMAKATDLAARVKIADENASNLNEKVHAIAGALSNIVDPRSPVGGEEKFELIELVGTPRDFAAEGFEPKTHLEIGEAIKAIDVDRGAKVSGSRFFFLTGQGALLEFALLNLAMAQATANGFIPMITPALVLPAAMEGTGFLGQAEENVYRIESDDMYLVGTSEVPLAAYHSDEIIPAADLPLRYAGWSTCFRREAGSYGKDTTGIIRVHQFDKVEMFIYCDPAEAEAEHERILQWEKDFLDALELPYRVIDVASGDLGSSAARKFDIEAWIPTQGTYREVTSTSNTTEYQARRLKIRMRDSEGTKPLATLNGTLCAMPRIIVAILENHQQADGTVTVPKALQPFLGGKKVLS
jgi:seryl-tRNA synthetase